MQNTLSFQLSGIEQFEITEEHHRKQLREKRALVASQQTFPGTADTKTETDSNNHVSDQPLPGAADSEDTHASSTFTISTPPQSPSTSSLPAAGRLEVDRASDSDTADLTGGPLDDSLAADLSDNDQLNDADKADDSRDSALPLPRFAEWRSKVKAFGYSAARNAMRFGRSALPHKLYVIFVLRYQSILAHYDGFICH
jgi:hypothetical protein